MPNRSFFCWYPHFDHNNIIEATKKQTQQLWKSIPTYKTSLFFQTKIIHKSHYFWHLFDLCNMSFRSMLDEFSCGFEVSMMRCRRAFEVSQRWWMRRDIVTMRRSGNGVRSWLALIWFASNLPALWRASFQALILNQCHPQPAMLRSPTINFEFYLFYWERTPCEFYASLKLCDPVSQPGQLE